MEIKQASFIKSIAGPEGLLEDVLPQIAFIGRSNVGKSSLINHLTKTPNLCRTGSRPGVTVTVNLFLINKKYYLADLPGYGYAKMGFKDRKTLERMIFWYLTDTHNQFHKILLLIDGQVGPTANDFDILNFLIDQQLPFAIVATKIDKLKPSQKAQQLKKLQQELGNFPIIPYSAAKNIGRSDLLKEINLV